MSTQLRSSILVLCIASLLTWCGIASAFGAGRSTLQLFQYDLIDTKEAENAFRSFARAIDAKMQTLNSELSTRISLPALSTLKLVRVLDASEKELSIAGMSVKEIDEFWEERGALALLIGRMRKEKEIYHVRTRFFVGSKLPGLLNRTFVLIDLPVRDQEFDTTRDSHSAMTLYVLAMDSLNDCTKRAETTAALSEALIRAEAARELFNDFAQLRSAIEHAVQTIKDTCR